ncbi:MAG: hypothetical protein QOH68_793 [Nocardioidaceae bacterium]|nr:hypothetical protein [Nocardioidaceae bacterium]
MNAETDVPREAVRAYQRSRLLRVGATGFVVFAVVALAITRIKGDGGTEIDKLFGLPPHPTVGDAPYEVGKQVGASIAMCCIGLVGVALGVREYLQTKSILPLAVALSAAMIVFPEVFYDVIGAVYFPWSETERFGEVFTILGRTMPVWIIMGWFGYGVFCYGSYYLFTKRLSTRVLWYAWGAAIAGDVVFEEVLLKFDVYHYYGNQPLVLISELPWWWIPCNSVGVILAAALMYRFRSTLQGWRALAAFLITPMSVTAVYGFIALPSWIAVNGDLPWLPTQLLGLLTCGLGVAVFMGVLKLVLNRDPLDLDYVPASGADEFAAIR